MKTLHFLLVVPLVFSGCFIGETWSNTVCRPSDRKWKLGTTLRANCKGSTGVATLTPSGEVKKVASSGGKNPVPSEYLFEVQTVSGSSMFLPQAQLTCDGLDFYLKGEATDPLKAVLWCRSTVSAEPGALPGISCSYARGIDRGAEGLLSPVESGGLPEADCKVEGETFAP